MQHFDVVIIGAGISGIGAACHLQKHNPNKSFAILEARERSGGTWDLFKYPGIRSDSDMHTLGFNFKPWKAAKAIADGPSIKRYLNETIAEHDLEQHIHYSQKLKSSSWSSEQQAWTLKTQSDDAYSCNFLMMCSGYYSYDKPYQPEFKGQKDFQGTLIHPQHWPEDLDYANKKVVVIGSGATAMTLVPAMADKAASVTMVQRSPTYVVSRPDEDAIANGLRKWLPSGMAYTLTRFKNTQLQKFMYKKMRTEPEKMKKALIGLVRKELNADVDVDKHFTPNYNPWDQRLCLIPNGDLFNSINEGKTKVVTDHIDCFTQTGVRLVSGEEIEADILVTATGLNMEFLGGSQFDVDGKPVNFTDTLAYKGMMYTDVPNMIQTFGYINASWTLRADLTAEYACRVINQMDSLGVTQCTPRLREADLSMELRPWIEGFSAGYMERAMDSFPKQGSNDPWRNTQNYALDKKMIRNAPLEDGALVFGPSEQKFTHPGLASPISTRDAA